MGSSHSRPSETPSPAPDIPPPHRRTPFRRISTFARRDSGVKRTRQASRDTIPEEKKKPRLSDLAPVVEPEERGGPGPSTTASRAASSLHLPSLPVNNSIPVDASPIDAVSPSTPNLRPLSTGNGALGPEWSPPPTEGPTLGRLIRQFRRQSLPNPNASRGMSDRLTALLGISSSIPIPPPPVQPLPDTPSTGNMLSEVTAQLEQAQSERAETERQLREVEQRLQDNDVARTRATERQRELAAEIDQAQAERRTIPAGAVLVIQGLAQTQVTPQHQEVGTSDAATVTGVPGSTRPRFGRQRRSSDSNVQRPQRSEENNGASLEAQARMIGGLLTVAAAATAATLLSPQSSTPADTRSTPRSALSSIMDRIRPNHFRSSQSVESVLGGYLRNALRDERRQGGGRDHTAPAQTAAEINISEGFQTFLETMQRDLVVAVREFSAPLPQATPPPGQAEVVESSDGSVLAAALDEAAVPTFHHQLGQNLPGVTRNRSGITGGTDGIPRRLNFFRAHLFPPADDPRAATSSPPTTTTGTDTTPLDIAQPQTGREPISPIPSDAQAGDIFTPTLNPTNPPEQPEAMIPCVFIGVRSISHDPDLTTEDLVQHPSFPFVDGHVTTPSTESSTSPSASPTSSTTSPNEARSPAQTNTTPSNPIEARRSLRERVLERLSSRPRSTSTPRNTYLVYVIGGNYPRSHPILRIPSLLTGDPLTDEELALISELMGPAKPPTASREDIERAGLRVIDGGLMGGLGEGGEVLESCAERCLICLGDYETGEECRVLKCRHAYHSECVDKWLETGSNSCPACRTAAVETGKGMRDVGNQTEVGVVEPIEAGASDDAEVSGSGTSAGLGV